MVSIIGLDSDKVQQLCDAANQEVDEDNKVQIANYLCPVRFWNTPLIDLINLAGYFILLFKHQTFIMECILLW